MVSFYQGGKKRKSALSTKGNNSVTVRIDNWDARGRGVCRSHQPVLFVDGALPGEECTVTVTKQKKQVWEGRVTAVLEPSPQRQQPFCKVAGRCGGCDLQHLATDSALAWRQAALDAEFTKRHALPLVPWAPPILHAATQYRRKTRLAVDARKPNRVIVGYRAAQSSEIVAVTDCPVLQQDLNHLLAPLHTLVSSLQGAKAIGHISLLAADNGLGVTLRCVRPLNNNDQQRLHNFATQHNVLLRVDYGTKDGQRRVETLFQSVDHLRCEVAGAGAIQVTTEDFVQVNKAVNTAMIHQAIDWLGADKQGAVLDLFCGLGNFSIPLARHFAKVTAIEGVASMVQRATKTAQEQGIDNLDFHHADLTNVSQLQSLDASIYDKVLLDPSREGAYQVCQWIAAGSAKTVVYVSCNPATFNRDLSALLAGGFTLRKVGLMEMFPFTRHIELMAVLDRTPPR